MGFTQTTSAHCDCVGSKHVAGSWQGCWDEYTDFWVSKTTLRKMIQKTGWRCVRDESMGVGGYRVYCGWCLENCPDRNQDPDNEGLAAPTTGDPVD